MLRVRIFRPWAMLGAILVFLAAEVSSLRQPCSFPSRVHASATRLLATTNEHPFTARTKALLGEMEALGRVRFVVQGSGAILESMGT